VALVALGWLCWRAWACFGRPGRRATSILTHRGKKSITLCKDLRCLKLYRHVWSLMMRKDQKAMMSLLCSHRRKLCANDACMSRHVSLHDHFLCMSLALLPGTCWMSHAMKAALFS